MPHSLFDFQRYADELQGGKSYFLGESGHQVNRSQNFARRRTDEDKMGKSYLSFVQHNPTYAAESGPQPMLDKVHLFKEMK